jgi:diguanylate cyclase (GGDEF)-like protein
VNTANTPGTTKRPRNTGQPGLVARVNGLIERLRANRVFADRLTAQAAEDVLRLAHDAERRLAEQAARIARLEQVASTDPLTGLLNRRGFQEAFRRTLAGTRRYDESGVLLYADLDGFKLINDTYGHAAGDAMLRHVAQVLSEVVRATDYVARIGGDEFAILLTRAARDDGLARTQAIERTLNGAYVPWQGRNLVVMASIGIQAYHQRNHCDAILGLADNAMYKAERLRAAIRAEAEAA